MFLCMDRSMSLNRASKKPKYSTDFLKKWRELYEGNVLEAGTTETKKRKTLPMQFQNILLKVYVCWNYIPIYGSSKARREMHTASIFLKLCATREKFLPAMFL